MLLDNAESLIKKTAMKREYNQVRDIKIYPHYLDHPEGSALIECGKTRVICTASIDEKVPKWMSKTGKGWVTAEYDMLPRATGSRRNRDSYRGKINGRTQEISRLIGRSLRSAINMKKLGERMITVDCDVIQADGGTRTASITGGFVALALAIRQLQVEGKLEQDPIIDHVAAISAGIVGGKPYLDLDYILDSEADVDMNVIMTGGGRLTEVQGTGENATFTRDELNTLLDLSFDCLPQLVEIQKLAIDLPRDTDVKFVELPRA